MSALENIARDLLMSRTETEQNYHRARMAYELDPKAWEKPPDTLDAYRKKHQKRGWV